VLTPNNVQKLVAKFSTSATDFTPSHPLPNDPWYIIFTSGSTGDPKGVVITRGCLESFVSWITAEQNFVAGQEVFLNQAPFSFDLSVMDLYSSLASGGTLFSLTQEMIAEPRDLYAALARSNVSVWVSTPSFAQLCLAEPSFSKTMLPNVRKFWFCGETLAPEVAADLLKRFPTAEVWNTYGPTEATVATTSVRVEPETCRATLPVGRPKPDSRIYILQDCTPVDEMERGEIVIAGPNVSPGYLNRPELTARAFYEIDGLRAYRTGDLGHFQEGLLYFDGRIDFQIKLHGYRIEIGDIEANLQTLDIVKDVVVIPIAKSGAMAYLAAFVILKAHPASSDFEISRNLKRELGQRLPDYMIPRKFVFLSQFPLTPNGKADRHQLADGLT
jgi:D-alanine--poly(phosphoribitol) ligase subunit 1